MSGISGNLYEYMTFSIRRCSTMALPNRRQVSGFQTSDRMDGCVLTATAHLMGARTYQAGVRGSCSPLCEYGSATPWSRLHLCSFSHRPDF